MDIINKFIDLFGIESIKYLVADREFVGKEWMKYLNDLRLRYYLRIKGNFYIDDPRTAKRVKASHLFNSVRIDEFRSQPNIYLLKGEYCYLAASKIKNKEGKPELQIIVSFNQPELSKSVYKQRWQIETSFKSLKTSGFNIEDTHLQDIKRIEKLFAVVILAFTWAYLTGIYAHENIRQIRVCKHGYMAKSFVKHGLEIIAKALLNNSSSK